jgi:hypothetical protein
VVPNRFTLRAPPRSTRVADHGRQLMFLSETRSLLVVSNTHDRSTAGKSAEHQLGPIDGKLLHDGSLAEHEVAGAVDAVGGDELATA